MLSSALRALSVILSPVPALLMPSIDSVLKFLLFGKSRRDSEKPESTFPRAGAGIRSAGAHTESKEPKREAKKGASDLPDRLHVPVHCAPRHHHPASKTLPPLPKATRSHAKPAAAIKSTPQRNVDIKKPAPIKDHAESLAGTMDDKDLVDRIRKQIDDDMVARAEVVQRLRGIYKATSGSAQERSRPNIDSAVDKRSPAIPSRLGVPASTSRKAASGHQARAMQTTRAGRSHRKGNEESVPYRTAKEVPLVHTITSKRRKWGFRISAASILPLPSSSPRQELFPENVQEKKYRASRSMPTVLAPQNPIRNVKGDSPGPHFGFSTTSNEVGLPAPRRLSIQDLFTAKSFKPKRKAPPPLDPSTIEAYSKRRPKATVVPRTAADRPSGFPSHGDLIAPSKVPTAVISPQSSPPDTAKEPPKSAHTPLRPQRPASPLSPLPLHENPLINELDKPPVRRRRPIPSFGIGLEVPRTARPREDGRRPSTSTVHTAGPDPRQVVSPRSAAECSLQ